MDQLTGSLYAYKNMGNVKSGDSAFTWLSKNTVDNGNVCRGSAVELVNYNGLGRADYYAIVPQTNTAKVWLNVCPGGGSAPVSPNLPTGAPPAPVPA